MKTLSLALSLTLALVCARSFAADNEPLSPAVTFRFAGGERIRLLVFPDPGNNTGFEQIVSDDGFIAVPVGQPVNIKGKTLFEAHKLVNDEIERASGARKISASIALASVPARSVYVGGEGIHTNASVQLPGTSPLTLYAAILAAGGISADGDASRVSVIRTIANGTTLTSVYDITRFGEPGEKALGPILEPGDVVKVPRGETVVLAGEFFHPGSVNRKDLQVQAGRVLHASSAIYATGGLRPSANRKALKILRYLKDGRREVINVDLDAIEKATTVGVTAVNGTDVDPVLQDGDVIVAGPTGGVVVLGKVRLPGVYPTGGPSIKLTRAIATAGGFAEFAKTSAVTVIKAGTNTATHVDLSKITTSSFNDPDLEDGDLVYVGERLL